MKKENWNEQAYILNVRDVPADVAKKVDLNIFVLGGKKENTALPLKGKINFLVAKEDNNYFAFKIKPVTIEDLLKTYFAVQSLKTSSKGVFQKGAKSNRPLPSSKIRRGN